MHINFPHTIALWNSLPSSLHSCSLCNVQFHLICFSLVCSFVYILWRHVSYYQKNTSVPRTKFPGVGPWTMAPPNKIPDGPKICSRTTRAKDRISLIEDCGLASDLVDSDLWVGASERRPACMSCAAEYRSCPGFTVLTPFRPRSQL